MAISLTETKQRKARCDVYKLVTRQGFKQGDLIVEYNILGSPSPIEAQEIKDLAEDDAQAATDAFIDIFIKRVASWDLYEGDPKEGGEPIPLTPADLADVPFELLTDVMEAITAHMQPGEVRGPSQRRR